jgi:hypothetical protein
LLLSNSLAVIGAVSSAAQDWDCVNAITVLAKLLPTEAQSRDVSKLSLIVYDDTRRRGIEIELLTAERRALARLNRSEEQEHFTGQYSASRPEYSSRHSLPQTLVPVQSF